MSPTLLAHVQRIARQTRDNIMLSNAEARAYRAQGRYERAYTVRDFYRPAELVTRYSWCRL